MIKSILSALLLSCDFETGYVPSWSSLVYRCPEEYSFLNYRESFFVSTSPSLEYKCFFVDYTYTFFASPAKQTFTANAYRGVWELETGLKFRFDNMIMLTLEYGHNCGHTIVTNSKSIYDKPQLTDVAYDKFSICISFSNRKD